jgi:hypothetical protein
LLWSVGLIFPSSARRESFGEQHTQTEARDSKTIFPKEHWPLHVSSQVRAEMFK